MTAENLADEFGRSIPDDVAHRLRSHINAGILGPGDRLPNERDLAVQMNVSRLALRLAIRALVDEGYLSSKRGNAGGTYVTGLERPQLSWLRRVQADPSWASDLMEYRKAIETHTARLAAERGSADWIQEMQQSIDNASEPHSRGSFRRADHRFHMAIAQASGSHRLRAAVEQVRGELFIPVDSLAFHDHYQQSAREHAAICDAIGARNPEAAGEAMEVHLDAVLRDLLDLIRETNDHR